MASIASGKKASAGARRDGPRRHEGEGLWDRPSLLNLLADLLFLVGSIGISYAAAMAVQRLPIFPLRQLVIVTAIERVAPLQVEMATKASMSGNFFTVNLDHVRSSFEKLPWVRRATVRRIWPDGVEVAIEEQVAAARWRQIDGEAMLVNGQGEVFAAVSADTNLPTFAGPPGTAAQMLRQYQTITQTLSPLGRHPVALAMTARRAWQLRLDDGLLLELGREQGDSTVTGRLSRFVAAYAEVQNRINVKPDLIDMRYPNGFSLRPQRTMAKKV